MTAFSIPMNGQEKAYTAKEALALFKEGDYRQAEEAYAYLIKLYDRNSKYNYYYGICLLQNNKDIPQAVKRLKYASLKGVSRDAYYYLGRAYQLSYQFNEAKYQYNRFLKYATASDIRNEKAEQYIRECEFGLQQSAKIYKLDVYARDTVAKEDFLSAYKPAPDVGKVAHNSEFFESGLDPEGVLYLTERGDEVYFSMPDEEQGEGIYKMEKLLDGWSDSQLIAGIESPRDELHPFLLIDGSTIFFSSNRAGGMGGYDLYKANYDAESKSFMQPVNLGIPFNSPKDDYLFVADQFNALAWFASNRETNDSTLLVYTVKWDDSVVKNFVEDENEVAAAAALPLTNKGAWSHKPSRQDDEDEKRKDLFQFVVADTLVYSQFEHFKSEEARAIFMRGFKLATQKDSLSNLMKEKRAAYARSYSETELTRLVNDIIALEKEVYGLDDKIQRSFYHARVIEVKRIKEMVEAGVYTSSKKVQVEQSKIDNLDDILIPDEYAFYTDDEFARHLDELEGMYKTLFTPAEQAQLHRADSFYIWGNILSLEASKLLATASDAPAQKEDLLSIIRQKDSVEEETVVQSQAEKAGDLKITSLRLYHESLDSKYRMYKKKMTEIQMTNSVDDLSDIKEAQVVGQDYFKEARALSDPINGFDILRYEKAGTIKRKGVSIQEAALMRYAARTIDKGSQPAKVQPSVPKTYQELQGFSADDYKEEAKVEKQVVTEKAPAKVVQEAFKSAPKSTLVYKIQIGVFRNEPNASAVAQIPPISKVDIPGKELTKYFAGEYKSYAAAQQDIDRVRGAGFSGAFIVVFKAGKQVKLTEELKH